MKASRSSGVLLHPTSLPGRYGIGDLGQPARDFLEFLKAAGQSFWQVLPLGPTGYGDSPYQCFSAFAGNPLLISPDLLVEEGFLDESQLADTPVFPAEKVDYGPAIEFKLSVLRRAWERFELLPENLKRDFEQFCERESGWLHDYAMFRSCKDGHGGKSWVEWEPHLRDREATALYYWGEEHRDSISAHKFYQYLFFRQWSQLRGLAEEAGVRIIGDIPIFVAHDSADVWANPEVFYLDANGAPSFVAGVPPDYFSETGQLWGNPLYQWDKLEADGFSWWVERIRASLKQVDIVRLDHFRGFEKYWSVPASETTAVNGKWIEGPGAALFEALQKALGDDLPIIAEDLGLITPAVHRLREKFDFPGMRVLQFAFNPASDSDDNRPYNFPQNTIVYTGTHDNDTTVGWFTSLKETEVDDKGEPVETEREFVLKYLGTSGDEIHWEMIRVAMASVARIAIVPAQDLLGVGSEGRMNTPARESGNWSWRVSADALTSEIGSRLKELSKIYGRLPKVEPATTETEDEAKEPQ